MRFDSLIFDLDGTLWNSTDGILAAWAQVFKLHQEINRKSVDEQELTSNFGLPLDQIAANMFPDLPADKRMSLMDECCQLENVWLARHGGRLYPGEIDALERLSSRVPLSIVSNCQKGYVESYLQGNGTQKFFDDHECSGKTGLSKGRNIMLVMARRGYQNPAYIGDTQSDADAAKEAGIPFIYARYGFGQVDGCQYIIDRLDQLIPILEGKHDIEE